MCKVNYHGVDVVDWEDKIAACNRDRINFAQESIADYLADCDELTSDVYVFPKSISEIDNDEVEGICRAIYEKGFAKDEVHLLFSMRDNKYNQDLDMAKTKKICAAVKEVGMLLESSTLYKGVEKMVYNCAKDFAIDELQDTYNLLNNLPYMCDNYIIGRCSCDLCEKNRNQPMLKTKYIRYQIFTFRKVA